jgi:hypothetical protein
MEGEHTRPDLLLVPVRAGQPGLICLRTGRLASGLKTGLAFTLESSLRSALGPGQQWTLICEQALLGMLAPLGITHLRIDPMLADRTPPAAPRATGSRPSPLPPSVTAHQAPRHVRSKRRCSVQSLHEQFRRRTPAGCAVGRWKHPGPASAPRPA